MVIRLGIALALIAACLMAYLASDPAVACCPAGPMGRSVVNADQTVIIIWDAARKMQHFIRKASFKSEADDFGFLVPSPSQPELAESGNDAFDALSELTKPEIHWVERSITRDASSDRDKKSDAKKAYVEVLEQKLVAGFNAAVLETNSTAALVQWLKDNGYAFSPAVEAWAKPYIEAGRKITALKVAKGKDGKSNKDVGTAALRMSFKTEQPLFPYREPDSKSAADHLGAHDRLLRIYFIGEARYQGKLTEEQPWTGKAAWAGKIAADDRSEVLEHLKLPETTGPAVWHLTEFEDNWPYQVAPADVYFSPAADQADVRRPQIIRYKFAPESNPRTPPGAAPKSTMDAADLTIYAVAAGFVGLMGAVLAYALIRRRKYS